MEVIISSRPSTIQAVETKMTCLLYSYLQENALKTAFTNSTSIHETDSLHVLLRQMRVKCINVHKLQ
jgi:hypothetical protein